MYQVKISQKADKFLNKLDQHIKERLEKRLKNLSQEPVPSDAKFIKRDEENNKVFRYRIGDFRSLYKVKENEKIILIVKIDKRPRVYDRE